MTKILVVDDDQHIRELVSVFLRKAGFIKFTPDGGTIGICVQRRDHEAVVCISDTGIGIGIAPDDQARIFERFYKADKSRSRYTGGSGLGLAIAKKITEMHKGTIYVESALGAGTRLTVHLPGGQ